MNISRRELLGAATAAVVPLPTLATAAVKKRMRVVHMTDFHIQPELHASEGSAKAWRHVMSQKPKADLVLVGGDMVMDSWSADKARTKLQWDLYKRVLKDGTDLPVHHAIGNHDIWGIDKAKSQTSGQEALWAKKWFLDEFGYAKTYHSFDYGDWHFVKLDNVLITPDGYNGYVDAEQMDWLRQDLAATTKPTLVLSHIPLLSITGVADGYNPEAGEWNVGGNLMTKNVNEIRALFRKNPQVKLAVSGHIHKVDRVDYQGVSYLCGGAICGNWWKGPNDGFQPGYRILDLESDGTFADQYVSWGWTE